MIAMAITTSHKLQKALGIAFFIMIVAGGALAYFLYPPEPWSVTFPGGKKFAFSIVDDTDLTKLERIKPLYDLLYQYGFRTTKTIWVLAPNDLSHSPNHGDTLMDSAYRDFILDIQNKGFEIALHGVRGGSSTREDITKGIEEFRRVLGHYPTLHVNHSYNKDNLYWGANRWSFPPFQWVYGMLVEYNFGGEDQASSYFWGDMAKQHIRYVNQFTYDDVNLLAINPVLPYHLPDKPYVNYWFPTADGDGADHFNKLLSEDNLNRLEKEGGVCLVYAHLGAGGFNVDNKRHDDAVDPRFEARLKALASRNGWFAPASEILDYLREQPGWRGEMSFRETVRLEILFLWNRFLVGLSRGDKR